MNEEFNWLTASDLGNLFRKYSEDRLREVVEWLNGATLEQYAKVKPILDKEMNRRAAEAYERMNGGEWI